jgi:integrase
MEFKPETYHPKTRFRIEYLKPRGVFRIRYQSPDKLGNEGKWKTVSCAEIDRANEFLLKGISDPPHTKAKLKKVLEALYTLRDREKKKPEFTAGNRALVKEIWEKKYNARRKRGMKRPLKSKEDLERAVEAVGLRPLDTCDLDELADHLDASLGHNPSLHARRITWINSILKWLGRPTIPTLRRGHRPPVTYLTEPEFKKVLLTFKDPIDRLLLTIAFYTGMRLGEIFHIQPQHLAKDFFRVEGQMTNVKLPNGHFKIDSTKTGAERVGVLVKAVSKALTEWAEIPLHEREKHRRRAEALSKKLHRRCAKLFPGQPTKECNFHALRHSNAIWLLSKGVSMYEVAQHLGNKHEVTERYYSGFELKKESISRLRKMIDAS